MVYVERNKASVISSNLLHPHYTNDLFRKPQTVFLAPGHSTQLSYGEPSVAGAKYAYSDRIWSWYSSEEVQRAGEVAKQKAKKNSALYYEVYLREVMKDPGLTLVHILAGVNLGNGYPYNVYGYIPGKQT